MPRILVVDDDSVILELIDEILKSHGYEVVTALSGNSGIEELEKDFFDLVLTDLVMPDITGMDILAYITQNLPDTKCIILTGYGTISSSVDAMKRGAFDYISKPMSSSELLVVVEKALEFKNLEQENIRLKNELRQTYRYKNFVGTSQAITKIYEIIEKVSDTDSTIFITGASGTGKELIARAIHYNSGRNNKPLIVINCGAIPEELLESELFGHEKGAFTGAYKSRIGRFEMANGGTIFLDEIGEMSPSLQVKLLRVLQEQKFERVGGTKTIHVDVRVIAATNKNLTIAINKGTFREDLYYRLNVIPIKVPTLKQRKSDIPLLIDFFKDKYSKDNKSKIAGFSPEAMYAMYNYDWPGNIRELENVIQRLTILCDNPTVGLDDLPEHIQQNSKSIYLPEDNGVKGGVTLDEAVKDYEKKLILDALEKSDWVKTKAAKLLNINRTTLVEKIKKQKLEKTASMLP